MDAVYTKPGYLFRRMQQIAVAIWKDTRHDHAGAICRMVAIRPIRHRCHPPFRRDRLRRSTLGNVIERLGQATHRAQTVARGQAGAALSDQGRRRIAQRYHASVVAPGADAATPADRKTLTALLTQLVDLSNESSRVPLRSRQLEHLGKSS
jgi:hypothetical protein